VHGLRRDPARVILVYCAGISSFLFFGWALDRLWSFPWIQTVWLVLLVLGLSVSPSRPPGFTASPGASQQADRVNQ